MSNLYGFPSQKFTLYCLFPVFNHPISRIKAFVLLNNGLHFYGYQVEIEGIVFVFCWILRIFHLCFDFLGNKALWLWGVNESSCCNIHSPSAFLHFQVPLMSYNTPHPWKYIRINFLQEVWGRAYLMAQQFYPTFHDGHSMMDTG